MVNLLKKYQNYLTVNAYPRNITFCVDTKSAKTYLDYTVSIFFNMATRLSKLTLNLCSNLFAPLYYILRVQEVDWPEAQKTCCSLCPNWYQSMFQALISYDYSRAS